MKTVRSANVTLFYRLGQVTIFSNAIADLMNDMIKFETNLIKDIYDAL